MGKGETQKLVEGSSGAASTCAAQFCFLIGWLVVVVTKYPRKQVTGIKIGFDSWLQSSHVSFRTVARMSGGKKNPLTSGSQKTEKRHRTGSSYTLLGPYTLLSNTSSNTIKLYPLLLNPPMTSVLMTLHFPRDPPLNVSALGAVPVGKTKVQTPAEAEART